MLSRFQGGLHMPSTLRRAIVTAFVVFSFSAVLLAATPTTYIYLNSQPGDWVGGGVTQTLTPADGTFSITNSKSSVNISFHTADFSQFWYLDFGSPQNLQFGKTQYLNAQRTPFRSPTNAGIDVSGDGRGCNTDAGQFLVSDFALNPDGTIARLAIDFEQHCEGATPALYGSVRYNSKVTQVPRFGVGDTFTLKGNAGTNQTLVPIALSEPSANAATVQYTTADGTAVDGTDYVATTGTITFPAGTTSGTIPVSIIGDHVIRGNKTFKIILQSPTHAKVGAPRGSVLIRDPNMLQTVIAMSSQPGDYIGAGRQYLFTQSDTSFNPLTSGNVVTVYLDNDSFWDMEFAGPTSDRLKPGQYLNAQRYPFQSPGVPGLNVDGDGRGCNMLTGNFDVIKVHYGQSGDLKSFSVNFEQHCEGQSPALFGWLRVHTLLEQFSVTDAVIQGSSAVFTVTLSPPLPTTVSVAFSTANGTAIAGADYGTVNQTVSFSPGMTQQTVTVPLFHTGNSPKKVFYGQLTSPSGAAVWVRQGSAQF